MVKRQQDRVFVEINEKNEKKVENIEQVSARLILKYSTGLG